MSKRGKRPEHVTRADIESKLREIQGDVDATAERAKVPVLAIAAAAAVTLIGLAYVIGSRKAKKRTTVVEVKRV